MFKDIPMKHWFYQLASLLYRTKAISGYEDGTFRPDQNATRAEVASMIHKFETRAWDIVKELIPSVVVVNAEFPDGVRSLGSGVILDKQGFIATNIHVITNNPLEPGNGKIKVTLNTLQNTQFNATVAYGDLSQDIAILRISGCPEQLLNPVSISENVKLTEEICCIGHPIGYSNTVTFGRVAHDRRKINGEWIQTDCSINPGNSGGGAFNLAGELIGLPTWKIAYDSPQSMNPVDNLGFITPADKVKAAYQKALGGRVAFEGEFINVLFYSQAS